MCFSASASFGAAAALGGIGVVSLREARSRAQLLFAGVPLLFAVQQAAEGFVWRAVEAARFHVGETRWETTFLFFALFVWPVYVPVALRAIERREARRRILTGLAALGAALGTYLMLCATFRPSNACLAFGNLYYFVQIASPVKHAALAAYVALIAAPLFASSARATSLLAVALLVSCALTLAFFRAGFVSVWCFFAAALSGVVVLVVRAQRR